MTRVVYLIGYPGSGKTTALAAACAGLDPIEVAVPLHHRAWLRPTDGRLAFVTLGRDRAPFGGTDTLGMAVQPTAIEWLTGPGAPPRVLAEGDRLGNASFVDALREAAVDVRLLYLDTPREVAAARREARSREVGSVQNEAWVRGRETKVDRLVARYDPPRLDGTGCTEALATELLASVYSG